MTARKDNTLATVSIFSDLPGALEKYYRAAVGKYILIHTGIILKNHEYILSGKWSEKNDPHITLKGIPIPLDIRIHLSTICEFRKFLKSGENGAACYLIPVTVNNLPYLAYMTVADNGVGVNNECLITVYTKAESAAFLYRRTVPPDGFCHRREKPAAKDKVHESDKDRTDTASSGSWSGPEWKNITLDSVMRIISDDCRLGALQWLCAGRDAGDLAVDRIRNNIIAPVFSFSSSREEFDELLDFVIELVDSNAPDDENGLPASLLHTERIARQRDEYSVKIAAELARSTKGFKQILIDIHNLAQNISREAVPEETAESLFRTMLSTRLQEGRFRNVLSSLISCSQTASDNSLYLLLLLGACPLFDIAISEYDSLNGIEALFSAIEGKKKASLSPGRFSPRVTEFLERFTAMLGLVRTAEENFHVPIRIHRKSSAGITRDGSLPILKEQSLENEIAAGRLLHLDGQYYAPFKNILRGKEYSTIHNRAFSFRTASGGSVIYKGVGKSRPVYHSGLMVNITLGTGAHVLNGGLPRIEAFIEADFALRDSLRELEAEKNPVFLLARSYDISSGLPGRTPGDMFREPLFTAEVLAVPVVVLHRQDRKVKALLEKALKPDPRLHLPGFVEFIPVKDYLDFAGIEYTAGEEPSIYAYKVPVEERTVELSKVSDLEPLMKYYGYQVEYDTAQGAITSIRRNGRDVTYHEMAEAVITSFAARCGLLLHIMQNKLHAICRNPAGSVLQGAHNQNAVTFFDYDTMQFDVAANAREQGFARDIQDAKECISHLAGVFSGIGNVSVPTSRALAVFNEILGIKSQALSSMHIKIKDAIAFLETVPSFGEISFAGRAGILAGSIRIQVDDIWMYRFAKSRADGTFSLKVWPMSADKDTDTITISSAYIDELSKAQVAAILNEGINRLHGINDACKIAGETCHILSSAEGFELDIEALLNRSFLLQLSGEKQKEFLSIDRRNILKNAVNSRVKHACADAILRNGVKQAVILTAEYFLGTGELSSVIPPLDALEFCARHNIPVFIGAADHDEVRLLTRTLGPGPDGRGALIAPDNIIVVRPDETARLCGEKIDNTAPRVLAFSRLLISKALVKAKQQRINPADVLFITGPLPADNMPQLEKKILALSRASENVKIAVITRTAEDMGRLSQLTPVIYQAFNSKKQIMILPLAPCAEIETSLAYSLEQYHAAQKILKSL
ncbi:MAG: hypothetical protein ABH883_00075 [Candidatus Omnitrophota bacterium]